MRIVLVHNTYQQPGGEDVVFRNECDLLRRSGHAVTTYVRSNYELEDYAGLGRMALVKDVIWNSRSRREFSTVLHDNKPDIVHIHNTFMVISPSIYEACQESGVPIVQTLHNYRLLCPGANFFRNGRICEECVTHSLVRGIAHACYRESSSATATVACMLKVHRMLGTQRIVNSYIALSTFARDRFIAGGLTAGKIALKPNFVFPDPGARSSDGQYALFVGRLSAEKGLHTLLEAWQHTTNVPLMVIGDGPLFGELQLRANRLNVDITFRGRVPPHETKAAVKNARFLILPSECYENFPMTIVEAFACGTPVICSRLGAMEEIVKDEWTGLQFQAGNPEDLASKVNWAWYHRARMACMGKQARQEFERMYTAESNYSVLMALYDRVLRQGSPAQCFLPSAMVS
jgi:glycosyltransferase involved in cell wall biosynthesis